MTNILKSGKIAKIISKSMDPLIFYEMTLHKHSATATSDADGNPISTDSDETVRGVVTHFSDFRRSEEAIPLENRKIILKQYEMTNTPTTDDEVTADGVKYLIIEARQDPANAIWVLQGQPVA